MAYPYYPPSYSPSFAPYGAPSPSTLNQPLNAPPTQQSANGGMIWVQGEAGAKSYLVGAGNSVLLMDSEQSRFYIKSTDASGMPMPLRIFEYNEISANHTEPSIAKGANNDYVTHEELERRLKEIEIKPIVKREVTENAKSTI